MAHEEACEMIRKNSLMCARIVAKTTGIVDEEFVMETYQISPKYCASLPPEYIRSTMKILYVRFTHSDISRGE